MIIRQIFDRKNLNQNVSQAEAVLLLKFGIDCRNSDNNEAEIKTDNKNTKNSDNSKVTEKNEESLDEKNNSISETEDKKGEKDSNLNSKEEKKSDFENILDRCSRLFGKFMPSRSLQECDTIGSLLYNGRPTSYITDEFAKSAVISVYNTVCSLLSDGKTSKFTNIKNYLLNINNVYSVNIDDENRKFATTSYLYKNKNSHLIYESIYPNKNTKDGHLQTYKFGCRNSFLLMWENKRLNIDKIIKSFDKNPGINNMKKKITSYRTNVKTIRQSLEKYFETIEKQIEENLKKKNGSNDKKDNSLNNIKTLNAIKFEYINELSSLETMTNINLLERLLSLILYIVFNNYELSDFLIEVFVNIISIPGLFIRDYWMFLAVDALINPNGYEGLAFFENFNKFSQRPIRYGTQRFTDKKRVFLQWQEDLRNIITLHSEVIIPVYENMLFVLLYNKCGTENDENKTLETMKEKIEEYLNGYDYKSLIEGSICQIYKTKGKINNLTEFRLYPLWKDDKIDINNYETADVNDLFEYIMQDDHNISKVNIEYIRRFIVEFFRFMKDNQSIAFASYNINYDTFIFSEEDKKNKSPEFFRISSTSDLLKFIIQEKEKHIYKS